MGSTLRQGPRQRQQPGGEQEGGRVGTVAVACQGEEGCTGDFAGVSVDHGAWGGRNLDECEERTENGRERKGNIVVIIYELNRH